MKPYTLALCLAAAALFVIPSTSIAEDAPPADPPKRPEGGARPGGSRRMDPEARLKLMTEKLGLDADQQAKLKAIFEKNAPKFKEITAKGWENLTDEDKTAMRDLMKAQNDEINAILTPAQQEKMKEMRSQRGGPKPAETKPAGE
jgi:Spy/CpxP family protein refolding chaperone